MRILALILLLIVPFNAYALSVYTNDGVHFFIVDGNNMAKDITMEMIEQDYQTYPNEYWQKVYMSAQCSLQQWTQNNANQGFIYWNNT